MGYLSPVSVVPAYVCRLRSTHLANGPKVLNRPGVSEFSLVLKRIFRSQEKNFPFGVDFRLH